MTIDSSVVKKIANLSKLKFDKNQESHLVKELNNILDWVDKLQEVETSDIEPMLSVFNEKMVMRNDEVAQSFNVDKLLQNSPRKDSDFFVVPKVIE
ncbi:MAG: Asp-tRNA(Asn)/Glu-tRNA(Gln) amidotransferase GatCAB subunit C [Rickettsiales bacterium]|nr:Asp-tRNA(Asn)/Glu-tRNA(Gln) amidotransferase GatCAB subunit C [Rickettsiales bacterium]OUV53746.1 MAG: aspartyl/glutamyl-tRNA(Asn/Gln) amidotransferase subunit C [Rickettsiales bacterium TMED127]|tara:strand:- start:49551 stop:49838 length:288 start_codon:yes stop_codon:yes gene_type:complete